MPHSHLAHLPGLAGLGSYFEIGKSQILSSAKIYPSHEVFSRLLLDIDTSITPNSSALMSNKSSSIHRQPPLKHKPRGTGAHGNQTQNE